jgi:hypothetical protein
VVVPKYDIGRNWKEDEKFIDLDAQGEFSEYQPITKMLHSQYLKTMFEKAWRHDDRFLR